MQTLILPGYSEKNRKWVDEVASNLKTGETVRPFYWAHWDDELKTFDVDEKATLIAKHIKGDSINIIAKSIGTLVTAKLFTIIPDQIKKVVLCGIPVNDLKPEELEFVKTICINNKNKITIIQNSNDPRGTYEQVKDFGNVTNKDSDTHDYFYFEDINSKIS